VARSNTIKVLRTTRASLNSQAGSSGLIAGEIYLITDEGRLAVGLTTSTYQDFGKASELLATTSTADMRAHSGAGAITPTKVADAAAWVALTDNTTIAWAWTDGINLEVTLAGSRTLGAPTGVIAGTSRYLMVKGNSATLRALAFHTNFKLPPTISDASSTKWYLLTLVAHTTTHINVASIQAL
jgi:hypothetical protein